MTSSFNAVAAAPALRRHHRSSDLLRTPVLLVLSIYTIFNLHLLRNVTPLYYAVISIAVAAACVYSLSKISFLPMSPIGMCLLAYLLFGLSAVTQTTFDLGLVPAAYGGARLLMVFPMASMVFLVAGAYPRVFEYGLWLFLVFAVLGVISVVLQYVTGPITWFAEASGRAHMDRFGSLLGNIPVIGAVLPLGVLLTLLMPIKPLVRIALLLVLGTGILASLSKQAISGSLLACFVGLLLTRKKRSALLWIALGCSLGYFILEWADLPFIGGMKNYATGILFPNAIGADAMRGFDYTVEDSMWMRMTSLPMYSYDLLVEHRGGFGALTGGGCMMLGMALMRQGDSGDYVTAHNNFMDFVLLGGVGYLTVFLALCFLVSRESLRLYRSKATASVGSVMLGIVLMYVTQSMFTGGLTYQPVLATLWWTFVGFAWRCEVNRLSGSNATWQAGILPVQSGPHRRIRQKMFWASVRPGSVASE
jgi:hypothetical protein